MPTPVASTIPRAQEPADRGSRASANCGTEVVRPTSSSNRRSCLDRLDRARSQPAAAGRRGPRPGRSRRPRRAGSPACPAAARSSARDRVAVHAGQAQSISATSGRNASAAGRGRSARPRRSPPRGPPVRAAGAARPRVRAVLHDAARAGPRGRRARRLPLPPAAGAGARRRAARTVNSSLAGPSLHAATVPPCSSTRLLHERQPEPEPAPRAVQARAPARRVEDARRAGRGGCPRRCRAPAAPACPRPPRRSTRIRPPGGVYLAALSAGWRPPARAACGSASSEQRLVRQQIDSVVPALLDQVRPGARPRRRRPRATRRRCRALQLDLAARDARHVEQVVDQPRQVPHLALDDRRASAHASSSPGGSSQQLRRRWRSAPADCAARGRAWPGTRPSADCLRRLCAAAGRRAEDGGRGDGDEEAAVGRNNPRSGPAPANGPEARAADGDDIGHHGRVAVPVAPKRSAAEITTGRRCTRSRRRRLPGGRRTRSRRGVRPGAASLP